MASFQYHRMYGSGNHVAPPNVLVSHSSAVVVFFEFFFFVGIVIFFLLFGPAFVLFEQSIRDEKSHWKLAPDEVFRPKKIVRKCVQIFLVCCCHGD